jgi:hypothetical protein
MQVGIQEQDIKADDRGPIQALAVAKRSMRALTSALVSRMSWMSRAGMTFENNRDLWTVFGYTRQLRVEDMYVKYRRQDVAKTLVDAPADALWTRPPILTAENPEFLDAWASLCGSFPVWDTFRRADITTGYGRFGIIVIGLNDGLKLDQPAKFTKMNGATAKNKVTYLQPFSELGVQVSDYVQDSASPRFGLPESYQISINQTEQGVAGRAISAPRFSHKVHWTRVIHIADNVVEDTVFGIPRLEPVYNLLDDLLKVAGGAAETYWLTANRGMQMDLDKDMQLETADAEALEDEVEEYHHNLRRFLRTRGVKVTELGTRTATARDPIDAIISLIAATSRIPQRLLMGSEAGQLASEQDRANWAERVGERRKKFAEPRVLAPAIDQFVSLGLLPQPVNMKIEWPDAFILGPLESAQTSAQKARSAANLSKVLIDHPNDGFISVDEARRIVGLGDETRILDDTPLDVVPVSQ